MHNFIFYKIFFLPPGTKDLRKKLILIRARKVRKTYVKLNAYDSNKGYVIHYIILGKEKYIYFIYIYIYIYIIQ